MSSMLSSQGMALATAMAAVSGTVILLSFCIQKTIPNTQLPLHHTHHKISPPILRSCISSDSRKKKKKHQQKKRVHFAEDVVDPNGNGEEFRKQHELAWNSSSSPASEKADDQNGAGNRGMPANRVALYNGILRDRVVHRFAYSC